MRPLLAGVTLGQSCVNKSHRAKASSLPLQGRSGLLGCARTCSCLWHANDATVRQMMNIISLIIGFVALVSCIVAFIPLLGIGQWLVLPLAIFGAAITTISRYTASRNV